MWIVISVILIAGLVGGYASGVLARSNKEISSNNLMSYKKSMLIGVVASFMVPLFLQIGDSKLIETITNSVTDEKGLKIDKVLVLVGFCLIAAVSGKRFIENVSEKVLKETRDELKNTRANLKNTLDIIEADDDTDDDANSAQGEAEEVQPPQEVPLQPVSKDILKALFDNAVTRRSIFGLSKELSLPKATVRSELEILIGLKLVDEVESIKSPGQIRYKISLEGRKQVRAFL